MKPLYRLAIISTGLIFLTSCTSHVEKPTPAPVKHTQTSSKNKKTNPLRVSFYTKNSPKMPYTVVGEESISKFNQGGIKRQEAHIRDSMRELAAAMGGDAVIDIKSDAKSISGTVVAFQNETDFNLKNKAPDSSKS